MLQGLSVSALLGFLGNETARAVLAEFDPVERERLAIEAAGARNSTVEQTERVVELTSGFLATHELVATIGVGEARERLREHFDDCTVDSMLEQVSSMATVVPSVLQEAGQGDPFDGLGVGTMARALGFLPIDHAAAVLTRCRGRVGALAMACEAAGLLEYLGELLARVEAQQRDEILDTIARDDPELATRLQVHLCGLVNILDLEYHELANVLGGAPVEDIALALMAADDPIRRRCLDVMEGVRGAMLEAQLESPAPVQVSEIDAAAQRLTCMVGSALDARFAPSFA